MHTTLRISGMHCSACAMNIDFDLEDLPGVEHAHTSFAKQLCEVDYDPEKVTLQEILSQINTTGYEAMEMVK